MSSSNCFFHISNVKASSEKPFEIKVDSTIVFSSTEDIDKKTVTHDIPIPKFASVHNVYMNILAPLNGLDELERYNLSNKGTHFIIDPTRSSNPVKQCFDESVSFTHNTQIFDHHLFPDILQNQLLLRSSNGHHH